MSNTTKVKKYYRTMESRLGYKLALDDDRHFGYYPNDQQNLSMHIAQELMNEQLFEELSLKPGSKVLDAGAGNGNVAIYLANKHGLTVFGIDIVKFNVRNSLKKQKSMLDPGLVDFRVGDYSALPYKDASFDGAYTMETFVHADDSSVVLREFFRVLKPGGRLVLHEYFLRPENAISKDQKAIFKRLQKLNLISAMPLLNTLKKNSIKNMANSVGFKVIEIRDYTDFTMPMMRKFAQKSRKAFYLASKLNLENQFDKHFMNSATSVICSDHSELVGYGVTICEKPLSSS